MKKILSFIFDFLIVIVILVALVVTFMSLNTDEKGITRFFGYTPLNIQSSSMEPAIKKGDLIITKEVEFEKIKKNDVISFISTEQDKKIIKTHRVIEVTIKDGNKSFVTKGDNNDTEDKTKVSSDSYISFYTGTRIAFLGTILTFLQSQVGFFIFIILPLFILFIYQLYKFIVIIMDEKRKELIDQIRKEEQIKNVENKD